MMDTNKASMTHWSGVRANTLAVVLLVVGMAGGWFIHGPESAAASGSAKAVGISAPGKMVGDSTSQSPSPSRLKEMADAQTATLLDKLKTDPDNPDLLAGIGNVYYDSRQYPVAIEYYRRALVTTPSNPSVRTDMATAYWYMGNADAAIAEFNKALTYAPNNPNTLLNLGLVKWKGKSDIAGALADWERLLAANPNYESKDKVQQMMAEAKIQEEVQRATLAK
jgi:cytochrome c-type biogenesis protein CcmH/NrfG